MTTTGDQEDQAEKRRTLLNDARIRGARAKAKAAIPSVAAATATGSAIKQTNKFDQAEVKSNKETEQ